MSFSTTGHSRSRTTQNGPYDTGLAPVAAGAILRLRCVLSSIISSGVNSNSGVDAKTSCTAQIDSREISRMAEGVKGIGLRERQKRQRASQMLDAASALFAGQGYD